VTLTVEMLRKAKKILQEAENSDNSRFKRDVEHFLSTGKCLEHQWITYFDSTSFGLATVCSICGEQLK
jgi:hypothetical protein